MDKFRQMEDEMSRFEAEISGQSMMNNYAYSVPSYSLVPHQINRTAKRYDNHYSANAIIAKPAVVSAKPAMYAVPKQPAQPAPSTTSAAANQAAVDFMALQNEVEKKLKKLKNEKVSAELAISQGKASSALQSFSDSHRHKGPKNRKLMRSAGGTTWEDHTLTDWPEDDFRIFCGDLGNDVTDELLVRTFNKFPSFQRAKVIRDKRTNKSKGYGFVSFKDPIDFTKAMKEMNGRYVGSRPIKLRKSSWRQRCIDVVKKKEKEKAALINMLTGKN